MWQRSRVSCGQAAGKLCELWGARLLEGDCSERQVFSREGTTAPGPRNAGVETELSRLPRPHLRKVCEKPCGHPQGSARLRKAPQGPSLHKRFWKCQENSLKAQEETFPPHRAHIRTGTEGYCSRSSSDPRFRGDQTLRRSWWRPSFWSCLWLLGALLRAAQCFGGQELV